MRRGKGRGRGGGRGAIKFGKQAKKVGGKKRASKSRSKSSNSKSSEEEEEEKSKRSKKRFSRFYKVPSETYRTKEDVIRAFGYTIERQLDKGGFGTIYIANDNRKNIKVACKWMNLGVAENDPRMLDTRNELTILEQVRHPYVIKVHCHFLVAADGVNNMYCFMELADGGNLLKYLQKRETLLAEDEPLCGKYFAQIVCGINHMHAYAIAHRDIKLQNILLVSSERSLSGDYLLRVSDFGLSTTVKDNNGPEGPRLNETICGTPIFMAPELLDRKPYDAFQVDIWALGITLYVMLTLEIPFEFRRRDSSQIVLDMNAQKWDWPDAVRPSRDLDSIMREMLRPDFRERIKLAKLIRHRWIAQYYQAAHAISDRIKAEEYKKYKNRKT